MRAHIISAAALLVLPLASGCVRARAATTTAESSPAAVHRVAGDCPAGAGPMLPAAAGAPADRNGDGYVCRKRAVSITGETLILYVDDDAHGAAEVTMALYGGM